MLNLFARFSGLRVRVATGDWRVLRMRLLREYTGFYFAKLPLSPTSHYGRPFSRIEDYQLKVNITSAIRRAIWRPLHGMVGVSVFLKFRDQASDFVTNCGVHAFEPLSPRKAHRGGTVLQCLPIKRHDHVDCMGEADTSACFLSGGSSRLLR